MLGDAEIEVEKSTIEYAGMYIDAGFGPIPVRFKGKKPTLADWPNARVGCENLDQFFPSGKDSNVGILLGEASGNLVDVDLDTAVAVALAAHWLPGTGMRFGPESAPPSHFLYRARIDKTWQFEHPETGEMIIELRGSGSLKLLVEQVRGREAEAARLLRDEHEGDIDVLILLAEELAAIRRGPEDVERAP